jgi:hypothetical protein
MTLVHVEVKNNKSCWRSSDLSTAHFLNENMRIIDLGQKLNGHQIPIKREGKI